MFLFRIYSKDQWDQWDRQSERPEWHHRMVPPFAAEYLVWKRQRPHRPCHVGRRLRQSCRFQGEKGSLCGPRVKDQGLYGKRRLMCNMCRTYETYSISSVAFSMAHIFSSVALCGGATSKDPEAPSSPIIYGVGFTASYLVIARRRRREDA